MARKDSNDKTRELFDEGLKKSAAGYADYAETRVSKLQQGYLRKYQPRRYASSAKVSSNSQPVSHEVVWRKGPKRHVHFVLTPAQYVQSPGPPEPPAKAAPSEEGIANPWVPNDLPNQPSASVSDDDCRESAAKLNKLRLLRADYLEEGYSVSNILYDIY